jgi:hypothetical protein
MAPEKSHATEELAGYTMQELHSRFPFSRNINSEHKFFPRLQTFITRKPRGIKTYFFFLKCNSTQEFFTAH